MTSDNRCNSSILASNPQGWVLDSSRFSQAVGGPNCTAVTLPCCELYRRKQPYFDAPIADAPAAISAAPLLAVAHPGSGLGRKRRRKKQASGHDDFGSDSSQGMQDYHAGVIVGIRGCYDSLVTHARVFPLAEQPECPHTCDHNTAIPEYFTSILAAGKRAAPMRAVML